MSYDNTDSGVLFQNDKEGNEKRPDYKGTINVNGTDYELAGWKRVSQKSGKPFLSLKVSEKKDWVSQDVRNKLQTDKVVTDFGDEPINLDDIPF